MRHFVTTTRGATHRRRRVVAFSALGKFAEGSGIAQWRNQKPSMEPVEGV